MVMQLPAWDAAVEEMYGLLAFASDAVDGATERFRAAARGFHDAAQPQDEARCIALAGG